ncbi:hypothetical protein [Exiguobacterium algae]|uniref:hypothetical protein n=1 Tax=Exiguobacterium algae TaxID=2751250 RepID=UPI001BEBE693|nr:hypothetical protein [Exiguobacterium algae]
MHSIVLEYRLYKNELAFEPLYHYTSLGLDEVLARRECEFFVKDGMTYKQRSSALEGDQYFLIYVDRYTEGPADKKETDEIKVEIRTLDDRFDNPLLEAYYVDRHLDALAMLGSQYVYVAGKEYERDSAETDEDRGVYVLYVTPTGYELEEES